MLDDLDVDEDVDGTKEGGRLLLLLLLVYTTIYIVYTLYQMPSILRGLPPRDHMCIDLWGAVGGTKWDRVQVRRRPSIARNLHSARPCLRRTQTKALSRTKMIYIYAQKLIVVKQLNLLSLKKSNLSF